MYEKDVVVVDLLRMDSEEITATVDHRAKVNDVRLQLLNARQRAIIHTTGGGGKGRNAES